MSLHVSGAGAVTDVVLMPTPYQEATAASRPIEHFSGLLPIYGNVYIGSIDDSLAEAVMNACEPAGEAFRPVRQFGAAYSLWRRLAPPPPRKEYRPDSDNLLYACVALSRLVFPTTLGFVYAARVRTWPDGQRQIVAYSNNHLTRHAFVVEPHNDYLVPTDVPSIAALVNGYYTRKSGARVQAGLWYYEYVSRSFYTDLRWPLLVTGLEALFHIEDERHPPNGRHASTTKVFVDRLLGLGAMDAQFAVPEQDLLAMYRERSGPVHGRLFGQLTPDRQRLYRSMDSLLRAVLRKALLDSTFAAIFASDGSLAQALPLRP